MLRVRIEFDNGTPRADTTPPGPAGPTGGDRRWTQALLEQRDQHFLFSSVARLVDRSIDDIDAIELKLGALLALQGVIVVEIVRDPSIKNLVPIFVVVVGAVVAVAGFLTKKSRNLPALEDFLDGYIDAPVATRRRALDRARAVVEQNEAAFRGKRAYFNFAASLTGSVVLVLGLGALLQLLVGSLHGTTH